MAIRSVKINSEGTRLAILADHEEGIMKVRTPYTEVFVFDRNKGGTMKFDFTAHHRCPQSIFWDDHDDRVLVCEAHKDRSVAVQVSAAANAKDKEKMWTRSRPPMQKVKLNQLRLRYFCCLPRRSTAY